MDDTPQGGAGGVPLHHDEPHHDEPHHEDGAHGRRGTGDAPETVRTVRAGTPVAEQQPGTAAPGRAAEGERSTGAERGPAADRAGEEEGG